MNIHNISGLVLFASYLIAGAVGMFAAAAVERDNYNYYRTLGKPSSGDAKPGFASAFIGMVLIALSALLLLGSVFL